MGIPQALRSDLTHTQLSTGARVRPVSCCVDDDWPPFAYVVIEGRAGFSDDLPEVRHWTTRITARHMREDQAEVYGARRRAR